MSAICYDKYTDSPIDYFSDSNKKAQRLTVFDKDTDEWVLVIDFYATSDTHYWLYLEAAPSLRESGEWVKYMNPFVHEDPDLIIRNHIRPKAVLNSISQEMSGNLQSLIGIRSQMVQMADSELGNRFTNQTLYVSGAVSAVIKGDGTALE